MERKEIKTIMENNIQESLFRTIDTIVAARLQDVSFDTTLICEVIEAKDHPEYLVKSETTSFKAYSLNEKYTKGAKVYVTVPQGNYNLNKVILGKAAEETISVGSFLHPLDTMTLLGAQEVEWTNNEFTYAISNVNTNLSTYRLFGIKAIYDTDIDNNTTPYGIEV